jgi:hypothetical protein
MSPKIAAAPRGNAAGSRAGDVAFRRAPHHEKLDTSVGTDPWL